MFAESVFHGFASFQGHSRVETSEVWASLLPLTEKVVSSYVLRFTLYSLRLILTSMEPAARSHD